MRNEIMFAGFGGQGIVKAALLLAQAAGIHEGKEVAQTQSYGPEARGGACRSEVVISDEAIDYIRPLHLDAFVVMSQPALDKYIHAIDPENTIVIADTTLIATIPPRLCKLYAIKATQMAEQELGRALFANIIMLGALSALTETVSIEALERSLKGNVPEKTLETNRAALKKGFEAGMRLLNDVNQ
ncbi:MAG: 2-oxoacid:acceptor oxidoreductase family protein [Deltaproteobacteria bacterium]|nr:2-oxoacid:acceptor oxidoreductase family protein [Deltaproteobacteria bacterium]MBW1961586.1 2-oxoacid:acceptor oxidoreductase family protein [Deltaproteobacteria bacterium]MBW1994039.1 2-oxoacid:acceptor oxidoreductase family protein [Deltaproteobacteria bacterium]MBW2152083.1 2-oxoacid:acceptor oxidoreductase family protein [Deltaproteobacteria bacterium]